MHVEKCDGWGTNNPFIMIAWDIVKTIGEPKLSSLNLLFNNQCIT